MALTKATYSMIEGAVANVLDYGAAGDGVANDAAAIQAAINAATAAGGGVVFIPQGTYNCGSIVVIIEPNVTIRGEGYNSTILQWTGLDDGIRFEGNVNHAGGQRLSFTLVEDIQLNCTNGANVAGGGYVDITGTFLALHRVKINGFGYSIIFDQSELADVDQCILQSANTALVWLVNGPEHTPGADFFYTNRISFTRNQFDQGLTVKPIIQDDGGYCHSFTENNYNGGTYHFRAAGVSGLTLGSSEWEGNNANPCIILTNTTASGVAVGTCVGVNVFGNLLVPVAGQSCIGISNVNGLEVSGNFLQTTASIVKISGAQNASGLVVGGNGLNGAGPIIDDSQYDFSLTVVAGQNDDVPLSDTQQIIGTPQFFTLGGTGSAFSITGLQAKYNGAQIIVYNGTVATCTVVTNSLSSAADNRIFTKSGLNETLLSGQTAGFVYRGAVNKWVQIY
jgi:hypothetical protein